MSIAIDLLVIGGVLALGVVGFMTYIAYENKGKSSLSADAATLKTDLENAANSAKTKISNTFKKL
jgi:uncharacterized protein (UPF0333 family)